MPKIFKFIQETVLTPKIMDLLLQDGQIMQNLGQGEQELMSQKAITNAFDDVKRRIDLLDDRYALKNNPTIIGKIKMTDDNSYISRDSVSPKGSDIGVNGVMVTHAVGTDEGGMLFNEQGAYIWNSTRSGNVLKGMDYKAWGGAAKKANCGFSNGLLFQFDYEGNLKIKGKFYAGNGEKLVSDSLPAEKISVNVDSNFGNATNLQQVLDYIVKVFAGNQMVNGLTARWFNAEP